MYLLNSPHLTQRFHTSFFNWCVVTLGFFCLEVFLFLKYHIHQYHISAQGWFSACKQYLWDISTPALAKHSGAMIKQFSMLLLAKTNLFLVVMDSVRLICEKAIPASLKRFTHLRHWQTYVSNWFSSSPTCQKLQIASVHLLAPADGEEKGI